MNDEISEINKEFSEIRQMRLKIKETFDVFEIKIKFLKDVYLKYINETENKNKNILFGLDSLHFQNTLIDFEYNNLKKLYHLIDNKIYCEYYKLLKLINSYVTNNERLNKIISPIKINSKYPPYKDLEPFKIYEFHLINDIHDDIINLFNFALNYCKEELNKLNREKNNKKNGLNLDNYINTIEYDIVIIKQNINLYINYLKVFHNYHLTYLSRLNIRINIIWGQVSSDIKLNSMNDLNDYDEQSNSLCPSPLSHKEHNEIIEIMKDTDIPHVKSELENIMSCNSPSLNSDIDCQLTNNFNDELKETPNIHIDENICETQDLNVDLEENIEIGVDINENSSNEGNLFLSSFDI
jgi:hypothetical protein